MEPTHVPSLGNLASPSQEKQLTLTLQDSMEASGVRGGRVSWCVLKSGKTLTVLEKAAGFLPNLVSSKLFPQSPKG